MRKKGFWEFIDNNGSFQSDEAVNYSRLYFPLMNNAGLKSWINPMLQGDICTSFNHYLNPPTVTEDMHRSLNSRNVWLISEGHKPWSATGMSAWQRAQKWENTTNQKVIAEPGIFGIESINQKMGFKVNIKVFVPADENTVELMSINIENISQTDKNFKLAYSLPLFGRSADNIRDHRQVTSMFQETFIRNNGVELIPKIVHDEHGHRPNHKRYFVYGYGSDGSAPKNIWGLMEDFIGEGGSLDNPKAIFKNLNAPKRSSKQLSGKDAVGAFSFENRVLKAGETATYIIVQGISDEDKSAKLEKKYASAEKINSALTECRNYWRSLCSEIELSTARPDFDNWIKWIIYQVKARQIFGNSFLPDFGYGRGGRGWRDLWQDLLSILLIDPSSARKEIVNNFAGVRIDGSNATIIGTKPGEFLADRNNVPRSWCDHGTWPAFVLDFYIHQSGDLDILFHKTTYWQDQFVHRSKVILKDNISSNNNKLTDYHGNTYLGSILEHIIIQQLSGFFNVGEHNILLLEGADWNDTYDMARDRGESVGFYAFYGKNLDRIANLLTKLYEGGMREIVLFEEISLLIDSAGNPIDYNSAEEKQKRLKSFFKKVENGISGNKKRFNLSDVINDFKRKSRHIKNLINSSEWITLDDESGFYNSHYDNLGNKVDGVFENGYKQIDLTGQVMACMNHVADNSQLKGMHSAVNKLLKDDNSGGYHLCRPFPKLNLNVGRLTGFMYGYKEHGSKWVQQNVMFAFGLLENDFVNEANDILNQVFDLCVDSKTSKIFPGMPSYFEPGDRGAYMWLTGSSAWLIFTLLTRQFGIRGKFGNLMINPKTDRSFFKKDNTMNISFRFRGKLFELEYKTDSKNSEEQYMVDKVFLNSKRVNDGHKSPYEFIISKEEIDKLESGTVQKLYIELS